MLVVTTNDLPGWEIQRVCGEVFGVTVRSYGMFTGGGFRALGGGELSGLTWRLLETRNQAMQRLVESARAKGGNAVVGLRFDSSEVEQICTEMLAYGTAVVAVPVTEGAKQTAAAMGYPPFHAGSESPQLPAPQPALPQQQAPQLPGPQ